MGMDQENLLYIDLLKVDIRHYNNTQAASSINRIQVLFENVLKQLDQVASWASYDSRDNMDFSPTVPIDDAIVATLYMLDSDCSSILNIFKSEESQLKSLSYYTFQLFFHIGVVH